MKKYRLALIVFTSLVIFNGSLVASYKASLSCPTQFSAAQCTPRPNGNGATCIGSTAESLLGSPISFLLYFGDEGGIKGTAKDHDWINLVENRLKTLESRGMAIILDKDSYPVQLRCLYFYYAPKEDDSPQGSQNSKDTHLNTKPKIPHRDQNADHKEVRLRTYAEVDILPRENVPSIAPLSYIVSLKSLNVVQFSGINSEIKRAQTNEYVINGYINEKKAVTLSFQVPGPADEISIPPGYSAIACFNHEEPQSRKTIPTCSFQFGIR